MLQSSKKAQLHRPIIHQIQYQVQGVQKKLEKFNINSEIQELSKFKISNSEVPLLNCIILITSPRSLDYLVKTKTIESCKKNEFIVIGKKTTQRLKQLGCKKTVARISTIEFLKHSDSVNFKNFGVCV